MKKQWKWWRKVEITGEKADDNSCKCVDEKYDVGIFETKDRLVREIQVVYIYICRRVQVNVVECSYELNL